MVEHQFAQREYHILNEQKVRIHRRDPKRKRESEQKLNLSKYSVDEQKYPDHTKNKVDK